MVAPVGLSRSLTSRWASALMTSVRSSVGTAPSRRKGWAPTATGAALAAGIGQAVGDKKSVCRELVADRGRELKGVARC